MTVPNVNKVFDNNGKLLSIQIKPKDWERFVAEYKLLSLKAGLKDAFAEVAEIKKGNKTITTLRDFLNELF